MMGCFVLTRTTSYVLTFTKRRLPEKDEIITTTTNNEKRKRELSSEGEADNGLRHSRYATTCNE